MTVSPRPRAALAAVLLLPSVGAAQGLPSLAQPGISPDGAEIAFVSGDDIWTVAAEGGEARLLVAHSAAEDRPLYSPDGRFLAFGSNREGSVDVWLLELATGLTSRLTYHDGNETVEGWSPDSRWVYFTSSREDVQGNTDVFRVAATGGTPMPVLADVYESEFWAAPGTRDRILISTRGRMARGQWWRNGHSHIDEAEIWLATAPAEGDPTYVRVSAGGKNLWPLWGADEGTVYWISDRDGAENLWRAPATPDATAEKLTDFREGRALWPTISRAGDVIAFERDFGLWTWRDGVARPVPVTLRGAVESPRVEFRSVNSFQELALSPDGEKVAVVARGEVFAAPADSGGPALRVTRTPAPEGEVVWSPDSKSVAYVSTRGEYGHVYAYDFTTGRERQLTDAPANDVGPEFAPGGERLVVLRDGRELVVVDVASGGETVVAEGNLAFAALFAGSGNYAWSPDGEWLAFLSWPTGEFGNLHVVRADGSDEARPVSFLANAFGGNVSWSGDGTFVLFTSNQRTEDTRAFRIDLVPRTPAFREDRFTRLFDEEPSGRDRGDGAVEGGTADSLRVTLDLEGIRQRASVVPTAMSVGSAVLSPDGRTLVFSGSAAGRQNLFAVNLDPLADDDTPRPLTSTDGGKGSVQFSADGRHVWFLHQGRIRKVPVAGGNETGIAVSAELEVDFAAERLDVFLQAWRAMRDGFYDPAWHGADWPAVREAFTPRLEGARTVGEMRRLLNLMVGELDGSHLGAGGPSGIESTPTGALGLAFDRAAYESDGILRVREVVPLGPAAVAGGMAPGDVLVSVDGRSLEAGVNLHALLRETVGERVELGVADAPGGEVRTVAVRPVSSGAEGQLRYRNWVEGRRAYVARASQGRLGYVHMADMSAGALDQLVLDLDQENHDREGVVVDLRNNNGGFVNAYALDVFTRRNYFTMRPRGGRPAPSRIQLGQRALLAPTVLVTNQHTLSDGEDFTEGYRTLELGPVVGEATAGWIIYTSNVTLFDGTSFRVPFIEVRGAAGDVMERNPRPVDIEVERPAGESYTGRDAQLDRAVAELLARIGG